MKSLRTNFCLWLTKWLTISSEQFISRAELFSYYKLYFYNRKIATICVNRKRENNVPKLKTADINTTLILISSSSRRCKNTLQLFTEHCLTLLNILHCRVLHHEPLMSHDNCTLPYFFRYLSIRYLHQ